MMQIALLVGLALAMGAMMSTAAQRQEARDALNRRTRHLWPVPVVLWILILEPWRWFP